ncbi:MAG: hypothetical protein HUJ68_06525 [Clostridia bacterium]|nr:hypothetical protein [Clostridia bacterium]
MSRIIAPTHIEEFCNIVHYDTIFEVLYEKYADEYSYVYKVICNCNNDKFNIYKCNQPGIYAVCNKCKRKIVIYDLMQYSSAFVLKKEYEYYNMPYKECPVYVNYEYSDEYLYEDDIIFDNNDISWAKAFVVDNNGIVKILDDETS